MLRPRRLAAPGTNSCTTHLPQAPTGLLPTYNNVSSAVLPPVTRQWSPTLCLASQALRHGIAGRMLQGPNCASGAQIAQRDPLEVVGASLKPIGYTWSWAFCPYLAAIHRILISAMSGMPATRYCWRGRYCCHFTCWVLWSVQGRIPPYMDAYGCMQA
jgi:hypothetical protein